MLEDAPTGSPRTLHPCRITRPGLIQCCLCFPPYRPSVSVVTAITFFSAAILVWMRHSHWCHLSPVEMLRRTKQNRSSSKCDHITCVHLQFPLKMAVMLKLYSRSDFLSPALLSRSAWVFLSRLDDISLLFAPTGHIWKCTLVGGLILQHF